MENITQKNSMRKSVRWRFSLFFTGLGYMLDERLLEKDGTCRTGRAQCCELCRPIR